MKAAIVEIEDKVEKLLVCLDQDVQHMQESLQKLNEMRTLVIKRDEAALGKLLENLQGSSDSYRDNESNRKSIRNELAESLGCVATRRDLHSWSALCERQRCLVYRGA